MVVSEYRAGTDAAFFHIVVQIPLQAAAQIWPQSQPRDHRRKPARIGEEGYAAEISRRSKNVPPPRDQRSAEIAIKKDFLSQLPGENLTRRFGALPAKRRLRLRTVFASRRQMFGIQPVHHSHFQVVGIAHNVALVETDDPRKILDAPGVVIDRPRLEAVLEPVMKSRPGKDARGCRRAQFKAGIE